MNTKRRQLAYAIAYALRGNALRGYNFYGHR